MSEIIDSSTNQKERLFLTISYLAGFILLFLVVLKGCIIPITHDESGQIIFYAQDTIYNILSYDKQWPTNHILNSLLIKSFTSIFGINQFWGRLPNFLGFLLYFIYVVKWSKLLFGIRILPLIVSISVLVINPYLFDFFSLARGYGMAVSFELVSLFHLYRYIIQKKRKDAIIGYFASFLMVMANFSWLVLWASIQLIMLIYSGYHKDRKTILWQVFVALITMGFSMIPVLVMNKTNQFIYWESNGIIHDTLVPLWWNFLYRGSGDLVSLYLLGLLFIIASSYFLYAVWKDHRYRSLLFFPVLLITCLAASKIQNLLLHTPYLTGRTALLFYPLFSLMILASYKTTLRNAKILVPISLLLILPITFNFVSNYTLKSVKEWSYDQLTFELLDDLEKIHLETHEDIDLDTNWLFYPSINFYVKTDPSLSWLHLREYNQKTHLDTHSRYFFTNYDEFNAAKNEGYVEIWTKGWHGLFRYPHQ
ncbi:MAG: hypothetical protein KDC16_03905 [Saprospiraceae bacterium]|nr:hypothetical protein [Saprospiraceae bacterium]MCB9328360.1 hypothetical protein [Lewinellaceae bacterium]